MKKASACGRVSRTLTYRLENKFIDSVSHERHSEIVILILEECLDHAVDLGENLEAVLHLWVRLRIRALLAFDLLNRLVENLFGFSMEVSQLVQIVILEC